MTRHSVFFSAPLFLAVLCSAVSSASAQAPLVAPKLMQRALSEGSVRVIVELGGMTAVPEGFLRDDVAVAIQRGDIAAAQNSVSQTLRGTTHSIVRRFETVPLLAVVASTDALRMLEAMRGLVVVVHEDALSAPMLAQSGPLVGAPAAWSRGFDGAGTTIAILDTGVDKNHGFLAGKIVEEACFSSTSAASGSVTTCPNGQSTQFGSGSGVPCSIAPCNHGTHVAGIAAGNGAQAGVAFSGVARGATIMAVQVFSRFTTSQGCGGPPPCIRAFNSDLVAGLERVYNLRGSRNFASVNMSLGGDQFFANCDGDPLKPIIDNLRSVDIATTISSGNEGFVNAIESPACISTAVSVGNTTKSDAVSPTSNVAPFLSLFAPGSSINSSVPGGGFALMSGTSMAAPHVAGAFAILKQAVPAATVSQKLAALQATGRPIAGAAGTVRPRIQIDAALDFLSLDAVSAFVSGFYQDVLGRNPEPEGLTAWRSFLLANCNAGGFNAIGNAFFDSVEFRSRPLTLDGLVTALYRAFLDRDPEPVGRAGWVQHFRNERVFLASQGFILSAEFRNLLPNRSDRAAVTTVVNRFYSVILGRPAEPAGLDAWVNYVVSTGDLEGAAVAFITSPEFENRPLTFRGYITILYRAFLGRNPETAGLDAWEQALRDHLIATLEDAFVPSGEFQGKVPQLCAH